MQEVQSIAKEPIHHSDCCVEEPRGMALGVGCSQGKREASESCVIQKCHQERSVEAPHRGDSFWSQEAKATGKVKSPYSSFIDGFQGGHFSRIQEGEGSQQDEAEDGCRPYEEEDHEHLQELEEEAAGAAVSASALMAMLDRQCKRCALTGRLLTPDNLTLDHIEPFTKANAHTIGNVQLVCEEANRAKGTMSQEEFIRLCRDVAMWCH